MKTRRTAALLSGMALAFTVHGMTVWIEEAASESSVRTVQGEVVAVNVTDSPHVIVVKAEMGKKETIVGATVESGVEITRGKQRVSLDSLQVGEKVALTYVKKNDGLAARSIQAR
jgi:hypothetical protein